MLKLITLFLIIGISFQANLLANYDWNGNYLDSSSNGVSAMPGSSYGKTNPTFSQGFCSFEQALDFTNDWVYLQPSLINNVAQFAFSFWVKRSSGKGTIISSASPANTNHFLVEFNTTGIIRVLVKGNAKLVFGNVNDNLWHHVVINVQAPGTLQGYFDGVLADSDSTADNVQSQFLILGQEQDSLNGGFDVTQALTGLLGEVRFYDAPLTLAEVTAERTEKFNSGVWKWKVNGVASTQSALSAWCHANCYQIGTSTVVHPACLSSSGVHQRCFWQSCISAE